MSLINPDTSKYVVARASSGARTSHNGDNVAETLVGLTVEEVKSIAEEMGVEQEHINKYDKLNPGQVRMNLGNRIRGRIRAINAEVAALVKAAEADDATAAQKRDAGKAKSGEDTLAAIAKPYRKEADSRAKEADKEKAAKAEARAKAKAEKEAKKAKKAA